MAHFTAGEKKLEADLLVFDKDGLMFDSVPFWNELTNARCRGLAGICPPELAVEWAHIMGADTVLSEEGDFVTTHMDPLGITAIASLFEERTVLAAFLADRLKLSWHEARTLSIEAFARSDRKLDLRRAIKAQPGYEKLMHSLMEKDIPYGVATSDNLERTRASMSLYGCWEKVRFVITPEDVAAGKPAPDMLKLIAERTGTPPARIAMIGDSYVDVKMAHAAGCIGIGVTGDPEMRERMKPWATVILSSLEELIPE